MCLVECEVLGHREAAERVACVVVVSRLAWLVYQASSETQYDRFTRRRGRAVHIGTVYQSRDQRR